MPELHGSPGHVGAIGVLRVHGSENTLGGSAFPLGEALVGGAWRAGPLRPEAPMASDLASFDVSGSFGKAGATFFPDVGLTPEPVRLPGPVQFVVKLLEFWRLEKSDAPQLLGFDQEDGYYVALVLEGVEQIRGRDVRERIAHLFRIRSLLSALFRDRETENSWLRERHSLLRDKVPMDLMLGGSMEDLLLVRDYVERAAGW